MTLKEQELNHIKATIDQCGGSLYKASKALGISRETIYRKLKKNNIMGYQNMAKGKAILAKGRG